MTTADRIRLLRRHGLENAVIAAVLGAEVADIAAHVHDPSVDVSLGGGGGGGDVTGLLPLDGSRAMTGELVANAGATVTGGDIEIVGADLGVTSDADYSGAYASLGHQGILSLSVETPGGNAILLGDVPDSVQRFILSAHGVMQWGDGSSPMDVSVLRPYSGALMLNGAEFLIGSGDGDTVWDNPNIDMWMDVGYVNFQLNGPSSTTALLSATSEEVGLTLGGGDGASKAVHFGGDTHLKRTAPGTLEIDHTLSFKGTGAAAGASLYWDDAWYGMILKGRAGAGDSELYVVNPDDDGQYLNVYFGGGQTHLLFAGVSGGREIRSSAQGLETSTDFVFFNAGNGPILGDIDGTGSYHRIVVSAEGVLSTVPVTLP